MRFNRMALQFGVAPRPGQQSRTREPGSSYANLRKSSADAGKLSFREMEDVVDAHGQHEGSDFVVGDLSKRKKETEEVSPKTNAEESGENHLVVEITDKKEEQMSEATEVFFEESSQGTGADNAGKAEEPERKVDAAVQNAQAEDADMPEDDSGDAAKEPEKEKEDPEGYREAMDLLRLIDKHPGDTEMRTRYGERWSLHGMIGLPFHQAEAMLHDAADYFSYHVGEIVTLAASGKVAGVVIFVDGSSIGVFSGEKILSYRPEYLKKTGRVFKDTVAACGLSM